MLTIGANSVRFQSRLFILIDPLLGDDIGA
jgi:hypothetical protein